MVPGLGGHLVSEVFLETYLPAPGACDRDRIAGNQARRRLASLRHQCASLGPASSLRALLEIAAAPMVDLIGFEPPSDIAAVDRVLAATIFRAPGPHPRRSGLKAAFRAPGPHVFLGSRGPTPTRSRSAASGLPRAAGAPRSWLEAARSDSHNIALLVAAWGERLDPLWRVAVTQAMRRFASWAVLFNGTHLRIVDATRPYARRYLEFDLDLAADDERTFAAFWPVMRSLPATFRAMVDASEGHASRVCRSLRDGVLSASADVLGALVGASIRASTPLADSFEQALTIVYRILFLLFAEARGLVPLWHPVYRESYSLDRLRTLAEQATGDWQVSGSPNPRRASGPHEARSVRARASSSESLRGVKAPTGNVEATGSSQATGMWDTLQAIARLAHAGCRAGDLRVTPFNGRLFAPARTPLAERGDLDDGAARRAVLALSTHPSPDRAGREPIAYRDLGVEQLGAVYETLMDYEPRIQREPGKNGRRAGVSVALEPGSGVRKATGTFYTPQPIAEYLIRRTLGPLVRDASPDQILHLRVVDPAMGSGAFLVAACHYLADAYEATLVRTGKCHASDIGEPDRAVIRRTIAERCLYGVDLNPMAVQLARLSLWLATLASDRPLTFLDHHLLVGDSLLGAWVANLRQAPNLRHRRRADVRSVLPLFDDAGVRDALKSALPLRFSLESIPDDTLDQVRAKEQALAVLSRRDTALSKWKRVADLWCGYWFAAAGHAVPSPAFGALCDRILTGSCALPDSTADRYVRQIGHTASARRFFHWELEFPEVFFDTDGARRAGAGFDAVIGNPPWDMVRADAGSAQSRSQAREDIAPIVRFTRDAGIYTAQSAGHANRYQLFLERSIALARHGGRIGLVLPSGLATDHGSAALRKRLLASCDVEAIVGFDNQQSIFPVHRSVRFLLVTASAGSPTRTISCRLGERDPEALERLGEEPAIASPWFPVQLTPALIRRLSGDDLAIPDLRTPLDLAIVERTTALFPPLGSESGWAARFGRELNATDDRGHFRPAGGGLPIVEGRQIEPFRVDLGSARYSIPARDARRLLHSARHERPRLGYRDVAGATNRLTLIAAILPSGCVSTHTVFCLRTPPPMRSQLFLCGMFNSLVVNYLVRRRVTTHVTTAVIEQLPIPRLEDAPRAFREIAALAHLLGRRSDPAALARLHARVAELYQLSIVEFEHVLSTFPLIPLEERDAALRLYMATETQRTRR